MKTDGVFLFSVPRVDTFVAWVIGRGSGGVIVTSKADTSVLAAIYEAQGRLHIEVRVFEADRPVDDAERHWTRPTGNDPAADAVMMIDTMFRKDFLCTRVDLIEAQGPDRSIDAAIHAIRAYDDGRFQLSAGMVGPAIELDSTYDIAPVVLANAKLYREAMTGGPSSVVEGYDWVRLEDLKESDAGVAVVEFPWGDTVVETLEAASRPVWAPDLMRSPIPAEVEVNLGVLTEQLDGVWHALFRDGERPYAPVRLAHDDGPVYVVLLRHHALRGLVDSGGGDAGQDAGAD